MRDDCAHVWVLDTSTLVSDPEACRAYEGEVVIPLTAVAELDGLKRRDDAAGAGARLALRNLEALRVAKGGRLDLPTPITDRTTITVRNNGLAFDQLKAYHLDHRAADNRILAAALGLQAEGRTVTLVTLDMSLRLVASQVGIPAMEHIQVHSDVVPTFSVVDGVEPEVLDLVAAGHGHDLDAAAVAGRKLRVGACVVLRNDTDRKAKLSELVRVVKGPDGVPGFRRVQIPAATHGIVPRSVEQTFALDALFDPDVACVCLEGPAGSGKTSLAIAAGLSMVEQRERTGRRYDRLAIYQPTVALAHTDLGFLPGTLDEKLAPWMANIVDVLGFLRHQPYPVAKATLEGLTKQGKVTCEALTHLRGRSIRDTFVLLDEAQNLEPNGAKTLATRLATGSKLVILGDTAQIDAAYCSQHTNAITAIHAAFNGVLDSYVGLRLTSCERSPLAAAAANFL